jgi:radical SAM protein with 4Fe4S-binding SPASM domain
MMINVDGVVGLCEHDFYFSERMGKVSENRLEDIWNSTEFKKVREHLMSGDRTINSLCASCDFHGYRIIANPKESYAGVRSSGKSVL